MKNTIELLKENNLLKIIEEEVDIDLEIPHISYIEVKKEDSKAILFKNPVSKKLNKKFTTPVLTNLFGSYKATELFLGKHPDTIADEIETLLKLKPPTTFSDKLGMMGKLFNLKSVFPKRLKGRGECQEVIKEGKEANLHDIPVLTTWKGDGGPFITMGQVYTQSLNGEVKNLGMYRLQVYDNNHLGLHWQIHKDSASFFQEYKAAGKKMPVSIAVGGDPMYTWAATAPLPYGVYELLLYGFIKGKNARTVKCITNDLYLPEDVDFVIEGWVDTSILKTEGPFGDHTGYYTLEEDYPVLEVSAITSKKEPIYLSTVVGKPPLEDKFMGWATERVFLPLLKTTAPDLIDYAMPENGVFHNLIISKMKTKYPGHAKQFMHAFWGVGQMSFVKHAIFVNEDAPELEDYNEITDYILDRVKVENILVSEGVCDALDHASNDFAYGGKLGIDCTIDNVEFPEKNIVSDKELLAKAQELDSDIVEVKQYKTYTKTPITVLKTKKSRPVKESYKALKSIKEFTKLLVFVDEKKNSLDNPYMLVWRVVNNIDARRDIYLQKEFIGIDGTNKNSLDKFPRRWPDDTDCSSEVIDSLRERGLIDISDEFLKKFRIVE